MIDVIRAGPQRQAKPKVGPGQLPFGAVAGGAELLVSRRGLAVLYLLLAVVFVRAGWLRPPLSADVSSLQLPLQVQQAGLSSSADLLRGERPFRAASLGGGLLGLVGAGLLLVLVWPRRLGMVAGLLLTAALAANAAAMLNYPALIERMEFEVEERLRIIKVLAQSTTQAPALSNESNGRVDPGPLPTGKVSAAPVQDSEWADLERGWAYLRYGRWLVLLGAAGVLLGGSGPVGRRLLFLAAWTGLGLVLACGVCRPRLEAEYHWTRAKLLEARGDYPGARQALEQAVAAFPEMDRLQRTWVLGGKLDYRERRTTARERLFRALQLAHFHQDERERAEANALMAGLLADGSQTLHPTVRSQATRLLTESGLDFYTRAAEEQRRPEAGSPSREPAAASQEAGRKVLLLTAAETAWRKAAQLEPDRRDTAFLLGAARALSDVENPERADDSYRLSLRGQADLMLQADIMANAGDSFFAAGKTQEARRRYAESYTIFCLAKTINFRAMKGLGGL